MIIGINDMLTLSDNNKYVVVSKTIYENKTYYYLVDIDNNENIKFCYQQEDILTEIEDKELITKLLPLFVISYQNLN